MAVTVTASNGVRRIAQAGLIAKGVVYTLLGAIAFMAAFELGGQSNGDADRSGVFDTIKGMPAGTGLLALTAAGLICYSLWRGIQTFRRSDGGAEIKWTKRLRYFFSGLTYLSVAFTAIRMLLHTRSGNSDQNQKMASQLLHQDHGQWLLGIAALIMAATGIYQIYYGLSEKYKKHVEGLNVHTQAASLLLRAGKVGYLSRGIVWLMLSYLLMRAALHANSSEAGNTGKAFQFIESSTAGSLWLGALGLGVIAYGAFNFIRARYDRFY